jgi:homoserine dehydrogenase
MLGGGTVGGGVYQLIQQSALLHQQMQVVLIVVKDIHKPRDFDLDPTVTTITDKVQDLFQKEHHSIDVLVEVVGGSEGVVKEAVFTALTQGIPVVTANKALIAQHLTQLQHVVSISPLQPPMLLLEAAVCGGIPIIHILQTCYSPGDSITQIMGICNGTTNYMLCAMQQGHDYAQALREAQALGYAEADPTADVEGFDVQAKLCILTKLAFGVTISSSTPSLDESIPRSGISQVRPIDFVHAKRICSNSSSDGTVVDDEGATIKLLGVARGDDDDASHSSSRLLQVYVAPHVVPGSHAFSSIHANGNAVQVWSRNMGPTLYTGPGAGRYPTANSIVADLVRVATHQVITPTFPPVEGQDLWQVDSDYRAVFYLRWTMQQQQQQQGGDEQGDTVSTDIVSKLGTEELEISVDRILDDTTTSSSSTTTRYAALVTKPTTRSKMQAWCDKISQIHGGKTEPFYMPVLSSSSSS